MAGRVYRVPYTGTITAAGTDTDLFNISPADDRPCRLVGLSLGQSSEIGDAQEENVRITIRRMTATVTDGSGGGTVTPVGYDSTEPSANFTARCNDTTVATTSGTSTILEERAWNERATPTEWWWQDAPSMPQPPLVRQTERLLVRIESTLADDMTIEATAFVEEL